MSSFTTSCARLRTFYARNVILFQIKVNTRNTKETTLARYFIKVTARPSFTQLRVIRPINRVIKYENRKFVIKIQLYLLLTYTSLGVVKDSMQKI